jgi:hypothetical protein
VRVGLDLAQEGQERGDVALQLPGHLQLGVRSGLILRRIGIVAQRLKKECQPLRFKLERLRLEVSPRTSNTALHTSLEQGWNVTRRRRREAGQIEAL